MRFNERATARCEYCNMSLPLPGPHYEDALVGANYKRTTPVSRCCTVIRLDVAYAVICPS